MQIDEQEYLEHYGTPRHSGRYPWGSGGNEEPPPPRNATLVDDIKALEAKGLTQAQIAQGLGMKSTTELRARKSVAKTQHKQSQIDFAQRLKDKGWSEAAISRHMNLPDSTVRLLLTPGAKDKSDNLKSITDALKKEVADKEFVDVGKGVNLYMGISETKMKTALQVLKDEGYRVETVNIPQVATGHDTRFLVLTKPGNTQRTIFLNQDKIQQVSLISDNGGRTFGGLHTPIKIDPKRVDVVYGPDGGNQADGVIFVRPGVKDVELGGSPYAQVRVSVGDGHYLKGMAMYNANLPDGIDLQFHTNKDNTGNKLDVMKEVGSDPKNPFGAFIDRQILEHPGTPEERVTSAMNIINEEGKWEKWSRTLSSQMLSKQSPTLVKTQLDMTFEKRVNEFDSINNLTNPTVKKKLFEGFADGTDAAASHLKAAQLPRQAVHVILPLSSIKPTEIYAPTFVPGERVVLIRHPHAGPFEIPELIVNNHNVEGKRLLGANARDAVGIHHTVAEHLSGADFDGDTVLVIPNNQSRVRSDPMLEDLKGFDPPRAYPGYDGMDPMKSSQTQTEMGKISNLITDMTLKGAPVGEIARAVKHSMVVIDAEKKGLNYRQSYIDNGIGSLKQKYQKHGNKIGASTLISRRKSEIDVPHRTLRRASEGGPIDPNTGRLVFVPSGKINFGEPKQIAVRKLSETADARTLLSEHPGRIENLYAIHSNKLKGLANKARLATLRIQGYKQSSTARQVYVKEVASLDAKLFEAKRNAPLERQANLIANTAISQRRRANPDMDKDTIRKVKFQQLAAARTRMDARKTDIVITNEEWNAIQARAISNHKLQEILNHADLDVVREHATPKRKVLMTNTKIERAHQMIADGYTLGQIAQQLGVSLSTLEKSVEGGSDG